VRRPRALLGELHGRVGADVGYVASNLMPEDQRILEDRRAGGSLQPISNIRATDAAPLHLDENLVAAANCVVNLFDSEITLAEYDDCLQRPLQPQR
jgi:hypothetical protein